MKFIENVEWKISVRKVHENKIFSKLKKICIDGKGHQKTNFYLAGNNRKNNRNENLTKIWANGK